MLSYVKKSSYSPYKNAKHRRRSSVFILTFIFQVLFSAYVYSSFLSYFFIGSVNQFLANCLESR